MTSNGFLKSSKPIILVFPFNLMSHYLRCLQLAEAIQEEFDIYFLHSDPYSPLIEQAGFGTFSCETFDPQTVMQCARNFDFSWLNFDDLERILKSQVKRIEQYRPIAVLGDTAPTLKMAAELTKTHYISLMNGYMTKHYACMRKIAKAHPAAQYEDKLPPPIFEFMIKFGEKVAFRQVHKPFRRLRKKIGLSPQSMYLDELEGDTNLICDLPLLFPQKKLPCNYQFVGPLFYHGDDSEIAVHDFLDNGKASILVSMGSTGDFDRLTFLNSPYFTRFNVVVAGDSRAALRGDHILSKPFINNSAILDKIDLVITHGGNGSIYQALAFGVPLICVPSLFEQEWNVQRVSALNLGASLDIATTDREIKSLIHRWIKRKNRPEFIGIKKQIYINATKRTFRRVILKALNSENNNFQKTKTYARASYPG